MKILLIGYGKMGKTIHKIAEQRNHKVVDIIDVDNQNVLLKYSKDNVDLAIEFTMPTAAIKNYELCFQQGIPMVSGTTGWLDRKAEMENIAIKNKVKFFYASNFSIGVNIFFEINKKLSCLMNNQEDYKVQLEEIHHTQKLDSPSGTAITLARDIIDHSSKYKQWEEGEKSNDDTIPIIAKRQVDVPGTHTVNYISDIDTIMIKHTAHTRYGFALGAVIAAEWLHKQKQTKIFSMKDMLKL